MSSRIANILSFLADIIDEQPPLVFGHSAHFVSVLYLSSSYCRQSLVLLGVLDEETFFVHFAMFIFDDGGQINVSAIGGDFEEMEIVCKALNLGFNSHIVFKPQTFKESNHD